MGKTNLLTKMFGYWMHLALANTETDHFRLGSFVSIYFQLGLWLGGPNSITRAKNFLNI